MLAIGCMPKITGSSTFGILSICMRIWDILSCYGTNFPWAKDRFCANSLLATVVILEFCSWGHTLSCWHRPLAHGLRAFVSAWAPLLLHPCRYTKSRPRLGRNHRSPLSHCPSLSSLPFSSPRTYYDLGWSSKVVNCEPQSSNLWLGRGRRYVM